MSDTSPGPTSRIFFSQRLRLHYVDWGNAEAPPLLLVHGGRDHCRNWDWLAERLGRDWHIIAGLTLQPGEVDRAAVEPGGRAGLEALQLKAQ